MSPLVIPPVFAPILFGNTFYELGGLLLLSSVVIVCGAIPLIAGVRKGHVIIGIIAALVTVPLAAFPLLGCIGGPLSAIVFTVIIGILPSADRPLLSQSEVEAEMRRMRGY